jgi:acetylglutamate kinase
MLDKILVLKVGGGELDEPQFINDLAVTIKRLQYPVILVHGGGKDITKQQNLMQIKPRYVNGLRVTDADSLLAVEMVLRGAINVRIVRHLMLEGVEAIGLSGVDRGLLRGERLADLGGYTGRVTEVRAEILLELLEKGIVPVVCPLALGVLSSLNVNADSAAAAIAVAVKARDLTILTNVSFVMNHGRRMLKLDQTTAETMLAEGEINEGMIPKIQAGFEALNGGVTSVNITRLAYLRGGTQLLRRGNESHSEAVAEGETDSATEGEPNNMGEEQA